MTKSVYLAEKHLQLVCLQLVRPASINPTQAAHGSILRPSAKNVQLHLVRLAMSTKSQTLSSCIENVHNGSSSKNYLVDMVDNHSRGSGPVKYRP